MKPNSKNRIRALCFAALCLALALVLPFFTGQIPTIGQSLLPMHLPVLLCGFVCGPVFGAVVGLCAPILRFLLFGMPSLFPTGIAMAVELLVYGLATGLFTRLFPKKFGYLYLSLLSSMLLGRIAWGICRFVIAGFTSTSFDFSLFAAGAFTTALPGIALQILFLPPVVFALRRARLCD